MKFFTYVPKTRQRARCHDTKRKMKLFVHRSLENINGCKIENAYKVKTFYRSLRSLKNK